MIDLILGWALAATVILLLLSWAHSDMNRELERALQGWRKAAALKDEAKKERMRSDKECERLKLELSVANARRIQVLDDMHEALEQHEY